MQETGNPPTLRERAAALFRRKNTEDTASGRHRGRKLAAVVVVLAVLAAAFLPGWVPAAERTRCPLWTS